MGIKIISGGQTGVDQIALVVAKTLGLETGGYINKNYMTEAGPEPALGEYDLIEIESTHYPDRTAMNVKLADCTLIFGDENSRGSRLAMRLCMENNKPCYINPLEPTIRLLIDGGYRVFNIAGNRGSKLTKEKAEQITKVITQSFMMKQNGRR